jgi:hypothetical protein
MERESVYVFVDGDAGMGKTRLLETALAPDTSLTWLRVSFEHAHVSQPFAAIAAVVRAKLRQLLVQSNQMETWRGAFRRHLEVRCRCACACVMCVCRVRAYHYLRP